MIAWFGVSVEIKGVRIINELFKLVCDKPFVNALIYIVGAATILNTTFISMLALSRFAYGLGKNHQNEYFSAVNERFHTPHNSIYVVFLVVSVFLLVGGFQYSAVLTNVFLVLFMCLLMASVMVLRIRKPDSQRPFRIPLNISNVPVPIAIGICMVLFYIYKLPMLLTSDLE